MLTPFRTITFSTVKNFNKSPQKTQKKNCILTAGNVVWSPKCLSANGFVIFSSQWNQHLKYGLSHLFCSTHIKDHQSVFNWFETLLYSPRSSPLLLKIEKHLKHQRLKHIFWQKEGWSDVLRVLPAIVFFIFSWRWSHHWTYGLSHAFCSTHIKAEITCIYMYETFL